MKIPVDKLTRAFKMGASVKKDSDTPVRVSVYLDSSASRFLAETVRDAFVPQTTSGIVRVERLGEERIAPKTDTDVVLVLSCGSDRLESAVQELVIAGAPVCVLAESAVEVPFIEESTPVLGVVAATDKTYLLETLARWILDRTEKETAFAANFAFMRIAAANRIITSCALTNMATGALVFLPGADYPVMALAQVGMEEYQNRLIGRLSGGQQQRVLLARALVNEPKLLILDEPTSALDEKNASHFYRLLKKINAEKRITVLMVTHDLKRASSYADDIWVLEDGKVKQEAGKGEGQA